MTERRKHDGKGRPADACGLVWFRCRMGVSTRAVAAEHIYWPHDPRAPRFDILEWWPA